MPNLALNREEGRTWIKKGRYCPQKGLPKQNKNEASSLSMGMVIMIMTCNILKNKSNHFFDFSLSKGICPWKKNGSNWHSWRYIFCYTDRINISINTWNYTWLAQTPQHTSGKHRENPHLELLYLPAYCKTGNIRSRKITPQNSNQLAREMELLGKYKPRTSTDRSLGIKY